MDAEPNDRKIGKLCEYASRNPLRIPKITSNLEQRCFKDLRNENFGCVKAVLCIYRKLLSSCKEQMPLFASCLLGIIRALLEQTRQDEMRILGCNALVCFMGEHCHISMDFDSLSENLRSLALKGLHYFQTFEDSLRLSLLLLLL
ncbi:hypothetical protein ES332_D12G072700v1 [Gossypium tomentosum]|uniref:Uncharacterized protein n=1 Tax=Gossypium tomentosum TaxID=34277 RepID=A0A5D2I7G8_GOSTO|nr:hypothetical protein ES332_D12G072700v1 [Gossypium tomentosum]